MTSSTNKGSQSTVAWWMGWILLTIASFFISCYFWTTFLAKNFGTMDKPGAPILWVTTVFGSWMILLIPLIIVMYHKVDKAYEDARIRRENSLFEKAKASFHVKSIFIKEAERRLSKHLVKKLKKVPEAIRRGHLVTATLKDGREVENVFILNRREVLGVYGLDHLTFHISDIVDIQASNLDHLPNFQHENWLRLDGVGS